MHQKRVDFAYNAAGQTTDIDRYWALAGGSSNFAGSTDYTYDGIGRLTNLTHAKNATTFASYTWAFDAHSRVTSMSFTSLVGSSGSSTYTYDNTDQLTATDHSFQTDEGYSYDVNGNRTMTGYTTGTNNRLTSDGTFNYTYDNEGNRLTRTRISGAPADDYLTEYTWDHHNRLTKVTFKNNSGTVTKDATYTYDVFDRRIKKSIDADGAGAGTAIGVEYVYDGGWDIQLAFNGQSSLTNRYLHGPGEDNILADEQFSPTGANQMPTSVGTLLWPLADNLGSVRDIVDWNGSSVVNHITYDAFGKVTSETDSSVNHLGGFQGAERDEETGIQLHARRFYDVAAGRWLSEDPIGFAGQDTNLARFVANTPTIARDPHGLYEIEWEGDWTDEQKDKILGVLKRVERKAWALVAEIDVELPKLPDCAYWLKNQMRELRYVLQRMALGIASEEENLEMYHYDFGSRKSGTWARAYERLIGDAEIHFNDGAEQATWEDITDDELFTLVFHELSHLYGTTDDDKPRGPLLNAHVIEKMALGSFQGNTQYTHHKNKALKSCGKETCARCARERNPPEPVYPRAPFKPTW